LAARGLKTNIAWNVALLLLISAVITDILVVTVMQGAFMRHQVMAERKRIKSIASLFFAPTQTKNEQETSARDLATTVLLVLGEFPTIKIVDADNNSLYQQNSDAYPLELLAGQISTARTSGQTLIHEHRYTWQIFWWHPQIATITVPFFHDKQLKGVIAAVVPLQAFEQRISRYHKPIFLYILINTAILTLVGLYRIFRLYLRPIDRIVRQADDFQDDRDPFFAFRHEDNELQRLSSALNRMLSRISKDRQRLQKTVMSLEQANAELQNAQNEILSAEKMASVGRLAAGIAHEIGNPIGIVLGYIDMLKQDDLNIEERIDFLTRAENEIQRINTVIRQLLDLARPKRFKPQPLSVHALIRDMVDVMRLLPIMKDIQIEQDLRAEANKVWGDEDQLRQVFLNIFLNAADAIHSGRSCADGKVVVRTQVLAIDQKNRADCLRIEFSDNGTGIEVQQLQNIFDPFYTTKEPGKGTGLGLAVSYMIVERLGGRISAKNGPAQGATFRIDLPLSQKE
jgi:two-component system, NtrC family, sensor kinase